MTLPILQFLILLRETLGVFLLLRKPKMYK